MYFVFYKPQFWIGCTVTSKEYINDKSNFCKFSFDKCDFQKYINNKINIHHNKVNSEYRVTI